jgi:hypothetical protein
MVPSGLLPGPKSLDWFSTNGRVSRASNRPKP